MPLSAATGSDGDIRGAYGRWPVSHAHRHSLGMSGHNYLPSCHFVLLYIPCREKDQPPSEQIHILSVGIQSYFLAIMDILGIKYIYISTRKRGSFFRRSCQNATGLAS